MHSINNDAENVYSMAFIIFTRDIGFIYYSKMFNAITATAMIAMHYFNIAPSAK